MKCPKCNVVMNNTHLMFIEQCPKCDMCFDVFHDKEVEYEWVYGDGYPDDDIDEDEYDDDE